MFCHCYTYRGGDIVVKLESECQSCLKYMFPILNTAFEKGGL